MIEGICVFRRDRQRLVADLFDGCAASELENRFGAATALARELNSRSGSDQRVILCDIVCHIVLAEDHCAIELNESALRVRMGMGAAASHREISLHIPLELRRRGVQTKIIVENPTPRTDPDPNLVALLVNAHRWFEALKSGAATSIQNLADREQVDRGDVSRVLPLAFLAPDIVAAILEGRQPPELTAARLKRMRDLPLDWAHQRRCLGFA